MTHPDIQDIIHQTFAVRSPELAAVVRQIHDHPELSGEEIRACAWQAGLLTQWGFSVETGYKKIKGLDTAYTASFGQGSPHVCFMAEYDALPGMGHGCGHHLIAGVALGAGVLVKELLAAKKIPGRVTVMGTPAEEQQGAKIDLIRAGALKDVDVVLMAHPSDHPTSQSVEESGIIQLLVRYKGRTSHAAGAPEKGRNALDAVRLLFNGVDAWRQQLPETCRVHGIIRDGGKAPNIIPDYSLAEFYLRDFNLDVLSAMQTRFENIAKGAALMTDTTVAVEEIPNAYKPGKPNAELNRMFMALAEAAGMAPQWLEPSRASSDFGDVTHEVPAMHAFFNITQGDPDILIHSTEFAACAMTEFALAQMGRTAKILAEMAWRFLTEPDVRARVKGAFPFGK